MEPMPSLWTRSDYNRLPEGFPAQLIEGFLVKEPSPTFGHQNVVSRLLVRLAALVGPDRVVPAPMDVAIDDYNVYQPDLVVLEAPLPADSPDAGTPLIAIEVASPATALQDRAVKRKHLIVAGVREVWIVDPLRGAIERFDAEGSESVEGTETLASRVLDGFQLSPASLFDLRP